MHTRASSNAEYVLLNFVRTDPCVTVFFLLLQSLESPISVGPAGTSDLGSQIRTADIKHFQINIFFEISASFGLFGQWDSFFNAANVSTIVSRGKVLEESIERTLVEDERSGTVKNQA